MDDKIKVFGSDDESLKILGELLSNETSRKIIRSLIEKEMYTNELSTKLGIRVSLIIHHLKKLENLGLLEISRKQIVRKGNNHRYFRMIPNVFLSPNESKEDIETKGTLRRFFRDGVKFMMILVASLTTLVFTDFNYLFPDENVSYGSAFVFPQYISFFIILTIGLVIERIISNKKKKKLIHIF